MFTTKDFLPLPSHSASRSRSVPTVGTGIPQLLHSPWKLFLPHPFSPLGTGTLSVLAIELWELLSKTINIFNLLFSLTALCSVNTISLDTTSPKWLGKNEYLHTRSSLSSLDENLCYPFSFSSKSLWRLSRPPWLRQLGSQGKLCTLQSTVPTTPSTRYSVIIQKARFAFWQNAFP